ncbi:hypothetical protein HDU96_000948 [Phlyctochytrium bullatum]|nr:hypothetical protein HDU96_000948 [Phlyctochytrium bullatum]
MKATSSSISAAMMLAALAVATHAAPSPEFAFRASPNTPAATIPSIDPDAFNAIAILTPTVNSSVSAIVTVTQKYDDVTVTVSASGLAPRSTHAIHFHAFGDITDPAGLAAGLHFNPLGKPHRCPGIDNVKAEESHAGDLGNIVADENGRVEKVIRPGGSGASLNVDRVNFAIGQAIILHANPDDCKSEPTGNAGGRLAQGVLGWRNATKTPDPTSAIQGVPTGPLSAVAVLTPTVNSTVKGYAMFLQPAPSYPVFVFLYAEGFKPKTRHGLHIHNFGDISNPAGLSAGGHYNPFNKPHACPPKGKELIEDRHAGDLGNIETDGEGKIKTVIRADKLSLFRNSKAFILGRAFQMHADPDDCTSQPVGNAGARVTQGVVGSRNATLDAALFKKIAEMYPGTATSAVGAPVTQTAAPSTSAPAPSASATAKPDPFTAAIAFLTPTKGNENVRGLVLVRHDNPTQQPSATLNITIMGLKPKATHAIHFHEFGDISDPTGASQFLHFNPTGKPHRCPNVNAKPDESHAGDIGNVVADENGVVRKEVKYTAFGGPSLDPGTSRFVVGRGISLHMNPDDCTTQPTGNAGGRIAQGVVGWLSGSTVPKSTGILPPPAARGEDRKYRRRDGEDGFAAFDDYVKSMLGEDAAAPPAAAEDRAVDPWTSMFDALGISPDDAADAAFSRTSVPKPAAAPLEAVALLLPSNSSGVQGIALLRQASPTSPLEIRLTVSGLPPSKMHGIHVHEFGDLSDLGTGGLKAGLHFNPFNKPHACTDTEERHAGDLGLFEARADGTATVTFTTKLMGLFANANDALALGRALIVHGNPDDCKSQPVGNAGARLALGLIGLRNVTLTTAAGVPVIANDPVREAVGLAVRGITGADGGIKKAVGGGGGATATTAKPTVSPTMKYGDPTTAVPTTTNVTPTRGGSYLAPTSKPDAGNGGLESYLSPDEFKISPKELEEHKKLVEIVVLIRDQPWAKMAASAREHNPTLAFLAGVDWRRFHGVVAAVLGAGRAVTLDGVAAKAVSEAVAVCWQLQGLRWEAVVDVAVKEVREKVDLARGVRWDRVAERVVEFYGWAKAAAGRKAWKCTKP